MRMNRRNVLVGLGGIVASGGALLGTGAFSTVTADRTVTVETSGDASARVAFEATSDYASITNDKLEISLTDANIDGTLTATGAFNIINNHSTEITLDGPWTTQSNNIDVTLTAQNNTLAAGGTTPVDLEIDTSGAAADATLNTTITITATT